MKLIQDVTWIDFRYLRHLQCEFFLGGINFVCLDTLKIIKNQVQQSSVGGCKATLAPIENGYPRLKSCCTPKQCYSLGLTDDDTSPFYLMALYITIPSLFLCLQSFSCKMFSKYVFVFVYMSCARELVHGLLSLEIGALLVFYQQLINGCLHCLLYGLLSQVQGDIYQGASSAGKDNYREQMRDRETYIPCFCSRK